MAPESGIKYALYQATAVLFILSSFSPCLHSFSLTGLNKHVGQNGAASSATVRTGQIVFDGKDLNSVSEQSSGFLYDYQADDTEGLLKDDPNSEAALLKRMDPSVQCSAYSMKIKATGPEASSFMSSIENALPSTCAFHYMQRNPMGLALTANYDGCMIQENGWYVLPMLWHGIALQLRCPMLTPALESPAITTPVTIQKHLKPPTYPWNQQPSSVLKPPQQPTQPTQWAVPFVREMPGAEPPPNILPIPLPWHEMLPPSGQNPPYPPFRLPGKSPYNQIPLNQQPPSGQNPPYTPGMRPLMFVPPSGHKPPQQPLQPPQQHSSLKLTPQAPSGQEPQQPPSGQNPPYHPYPLFPWLPPSVLKPPQQPPQPPQQPSSVKLTPQAPSGQKPQQPPSGQSPPYPPFPWPGMLPSSGQNPPYPPFPWLPPQQPPQQSPQQPPQQSPQQPPQQSPQQLSSVKLTPHAAPSGQEPQQPPSGQSLPAYPPFPWPGMLPPSGQNPPYPPYPWPGMLPPSGQNPPFPWPEMLPPSGQSPPYPPYPWPGMLPPSGQNPPFPWPEMLPPSGQSPPYPPFPRPGMLPPSGQSSPYPPFLPPYNQIPSNQQPPSVLKPPQQRPQQRPQQPSSVMITTPPPISEATTLRCEARKKRPAKG